MPLPNDQWAQTFGPLTTTPGASTSAGSVGTSQFAARADHVHPFPTYTLQSAANALTAAGTTRADALQLAAAYNNVTTAAASTGVNLPAGVAGMSVVIVNSGANAIKVYGLGSDTIDGTAGATGVTLTNGRRALFYCFATNTWLSLGVTAGSA